MWRSLTSYNNYNLYIHRLLYYIIDYLSNYMLADINLLVPGGIDDEDEPEPDDGKLWLGRYMGVY